MPKSGASSLQIRGRSDPFVKLTHRIARVGVSILLLTAGAHAQAAPPRSIQFNVTTTRQLPQGQVTMQGRVWANPKQARAEMTDPLGNKMVVLLRDGMIYQFAPQAKKGIKSKLPDQVAKTTSLEKLVQGLAIGPGKSFSDAKKVGTAKLQGYTCDVLQKSSSKAGRTTTMKMWMPRTLGLKLPLKAVQTQEVNQPNLKLKQTTTITLSAIKTNAAIPASVFAVPQGYQFTEGKPQLPGG